MSGHEHDLHAVLVEGDGYRWRCCGCDLDEDWFSDKALAKQAALGRGEGTGTWADISGIWGPRIQPADDERCHKCGADARGGAGGDLHFCGLHVGRNCEIGVDCPDDCDRPEAI